MTLPLPWPSVRNADGSIHIEAVQADIDELAKVALGTGGASFEVRCGTGIWTWPGGSTISGLTTVSHGLGRAPIFAKAQIVSDQGASEIVDGTATDYTATTFGSRGAWRALTPAAGATFIFAWFAIG